MDVSIIVKVSIQGMIPRLSDVYEIDRVDIGLGRIPQIVRGDGFTRNKFVSAAGRRIEQIVSKIGLLRKFRAGSHLRPIWSFGGSLV